jgi:hypothetical protein
MAVSTVFWRPVNMFRGQAVRAGSPHTSNWGLGRLSRNTEFSGLAINNLASRLRTGQIKISSLYRFETKIVAAAIEKLGPALQLPVAIISRATKGTFSFTFVSFGEETTNEWGCHHDGMDLSRSSTELYQETITRDLFDYNLEFFKGLKEYLPSETWSDLVILVGQKNQELGRVLSDLEAWISRAEEGLRENHPLPKRVIDNYS